MPIYEFACPRCRRIYSFLSKRVNPAHAPVCPKCGHEKLTRQMSRFAMTKGLKEPSAASAPDQAEAGFPDLDDPKVARVMDDLERDMAQMDENNPRHMAQVMKKMQQAMPPGSMPPGMDIAIRRLEAGEDPEKIEAELGPEMGGLFGPEDAEEDTSLGQFGGGGGGSYTKDSGLYDY